VAGLAHVVVPKSADPRKVDAEALRVRTFGFSLLSGLQRTNFTLGYSDDTLVLVRGSACVALGPLPRRISLAMPAMGVDAQGETASHGE
jgi:hypothetical protein